MQNISKHSFIFILLGAALLYGCSKSDDQRKFENAAFKTPSGITEMAANGRVTDNGNEDPDDWQIGPMFQGLIELSSPAIGAYPNPVNLNTSLRIDLDIKGIESISGLQVYVFSSPERLTGPIYQNTQSSLPPGVMTITLDPAQFSSSGAGSQASGIYRILIYDNRQNLITYGDVQVQ